MSESPSFLMPNYQRQPLVFAMGEGAWLWDPQGNKYLDALSGVAVTALGHAHPKLTQAISHQAKRLMHTSNIFRIELQEQLAAKLCALSGMQSVFFCNSGTEANEAAIKLARLYAHNRGVRNPEIVVMENAFHGRTLAALAATGNDKIKLGFDPLPTGFLRVPYGDLLAVHNLRRRNIVAVLVEPVQGEAGVNVPPEGYLTGLRKLCSERGWLFMLDEIQTGMGRTGQWFGFQHEKALPDVMTLAKGLGGGFPIGACLAAGAAAQVFGPGTHGSTFGGNPLACRAALAVTEVIEQDQLCANAAEMGARILAKLREGLQGHSGVVEIRGKGLMIGVELDRPCAELVGQALEKHLLINVTADKNIRLLPPLILNRKEADQIADTVIELVKAFLAAKTGD
ncbi:MAG: acetylornithine transaminase [Nevskiales bacterium]